MTTPPPPVLSAPQLTEPALAAPDFPATAATGHLPPGSDWPATDFLVRSEERLNVHTVSIPAGRVRLEKFVVTETRTITVQVSHEEVRLVRYDADGASAGLPAGAAIDISVEKDDDGLGHGHANGYSDGDSAVDRWLTLSEERVITNKEVVAVERVRLQVDTVTEQQQVTEQVRAERIEMDPPSFLRPPAP